RASPSSDRGVAVGVLLDVRAGRPSGRTAAAALVNMMNYGPVRHRRRRGLLSSQRIGAGTLECRNAVGRSHWVCLRGKRQVAVQSVINFLGVVALAPKGEDDQRQDCQTREGLHKMLTPASICGGMIAVRGPKGAGTVPFNMGQPQPAPLN